MDFKLSEEQEMFRTVLRDFVEKDIKPVAREWEREGRYPTEIVEKMKAMGLFGITVPESHGGMDVDTVSMALGRLGVPTRSEIASLSKRVEELTRAVEGRKNRPAPARKPAPKSAATATAKKAAGRKTTARKTTRATKPSATT